jgi:hypothetical protein
MAISTASTDVPPFLRISIPALQALKKSASSVEKEKATRCSKRTLRMQGDEGVRFLCYDIPLQRGRKCKTCRHLLFDCFAAKTSCVGTGTETKVQVEVAILMVMVTVEI